MAAGSGHQSDKRFPDVPLFCAADERPGLWADHLHGIDHEPRRHRRTHRVLRQQGRRAGTDPRAGAGIGAGGDHGQRHQSRPVCHGNEFAVDAKSGTEPAIPVKNSGGPVGRSERTSASLRFIFAPKTRDSSRARTSSSTEGGPRNRSGCEWHGYCGFGGVMVSRCPVLFAGGQSQGGRSVPTTGNGSTWRRRIWAAFALITSTVAAAADTLPGLAYTNTRIADVPLSIHIVQLDRGDHDYQIESVHAQGRAWAWTRSGPTRPRESSRGRSGGGDQRRLLPTGKSLCGRATRTPNHRRRIAQRPFWRSQFLDRCDRRTARRLRRVSISDHLAGRDSDGVWIERGTPTGRRRTLHARQPDLRLILPADAN